MSQVANISTNRQPIEYGPDLAIALRQVMRARRRQAFSMAVADVGSGQQADDGHAGRHPGFDAESRLSSITTVRAGAAPISRAA